MNDTQITLTGNVVDEPRMRVTKGGHSVTSFRLASTSRRKDEHGQWSDTGTLWVTVTCWRVLGEHVFESVHKGDPVVVTGRYYAREYKIDDTLRTAYELEAQTVGHDLTRGSGVFRRAVRPNRPAPPELDAAGIPLDRSETGLGEAVDQPTAGADVRHLAATG
jgi:single-strand DNA-binding protein